MEEKAKHGGQRQKAGRKKMKLSQKKISVSSYHKYCDVKLLGGMAVTRLIASKAITSKINEIKNNRTK